MRGYFVLYVTNIPRSGIIYATSRQAGRGAPAGRREARAEEALGDVDCRARRARHCEASTACDRNQNQLSADCTDLRRLKREAKETMDSVGPPCLHFLPCESAKICVICGPSDSSMPETETQNLASLRDYSSTTIFRRFV